MHPILPSRLLLASLLVLAFLIPVARAAPEDQPRMRAALELLQAAKESNNPLPMLNSAKQRLNNAAKNKGGERLEAIDYVEEAITKAKERDFDKMKQKINAAIANIHQGMGKAK